MRGSKHALVVVAFSVAGCAASPPPPPAQALRSGEPAAVVQWQQFCEQATSVSQASWLASSRGANGWELVGMSSGVLCYKRPAAAPPQPEAAPPVQPPPPAILSTQASAPPPPPTAVSQTSTVPRIIDPGF
jgi:hypothetical protein